MIMFLTVSGDVFSNSFSHINGWQLFCIERFIEFGLSRGFRMLSNRVLTQGILSENSSGRLSESNQNCPT